VQVTGMGGVERATQKADARTSPGDGNRMITLNGRHERTQGVRTRLGPALPFATNHVFHAGELFNADGAAGV